jgi:3-hydroxyacyl-CoA dehydrogenase/enoyl-CoA hydratase/3-hydroxybutyryl-CoA epimerase
METIRYSLDNGIATVTFDEPGSPVNTMKPQWQNDMVTLADQLSADATQLRGVLLTSAKTTFFAGADLKGVLRLRAEDAAAGFAGIERLKKAFRRIETLGKPVVSLIQGAALGGGWEVALIGHARFALDNPKIQLGLPEVSLGLLPGATGITKMTRLLGLMGAQPYLMEGKLFNPRQALEMGLVNGLAPDAQALLQMGLAFIDANPQAMQPWDRKDYKMPGGTPSSPKIAQGLTVLPAVMFNKTHGLYPAAQAILESMAEGAQVDYDTATRIESRKLAKLMVGQNAKNMITAFFFNMNAIKAGKSRPPGIAPWKPTRVGILGAGMMGAGIAYANAARGIASVLRDVTLEKTEHGLAYSRKLTDTQVAKGRMDAAKQATLLGLIQPTADVADMAGCDLIIEAVFENRELKAQVTREAEAVMAAGGTFASNTSTLPITGLAQASSRPQKFVGIHFFSPVDKMKLVEIIRGQATDDESVARAYDYVLAIGKTPIVVNDSRGFFTSRVFGTFVMEGAAMLDEGIPAPMIEQAGLAAGMPVGPLAVLDETSLSLSVHVLDQTRADFAAQGQTYTATRGELFVEKMVKERHRLGRAAGGGYYDYPMGAKKQLWVGLQSFEKPLTGDPQTVLQELKDRLLYRQAIETARCMAENVLTSTHDANIGSIFGIGFPAWTGGAMQFIYSEGVEHFTQRSAELAARYGAGFVLSDAVKAVIAHHRPD